VVDWSVVQLCTHIDLLQSEYLVDNTLSYRKYWIVMDWLVSRWLMCGSIMYSHWSDYILDNTSWMHSTCCKVAAGRACGWSGRSAVCCRDFPRPLTKPSGCFVPESEERDVAKHAKQSAAMSNRQTQVRRAGGFGRCGRCVVRARESSGDKGRCDLIMGQHRRGVSLYSKYKETLYNDCNYRNKALAKTRMLSPCGRQGDRSHRTMRP
jgi:hypothetical protein